MIAVQYNAPSPEGLPLEDPAVLMEYFGSRDQELRRVLDELARKTGSAKYIKVGDQTLQEIMDDGGKWQPNDCKLFCGTLAAARRQRGWVISDGRNGTTDWTGRFIRIAVKDTDAGDTGGSNTHTHTSSAHAHVKPTVTIDPHTGHTHDLSGDTGPPTESAVNVVECAGGVAVSPNDHVHALDVGATGVADSAKAAPETHTATVGEIGNTEASIASASNVPAYVYLILLVKL